MLNTISWQQYFTTVLLLTLAWYGYVLLRYYRDKIMGRFQTKADPSSWVSSAPVLGAVKQDNPRLDPEELSFGNSQPDDISDSTLLCGPTDELLAETQSLVEAFRDTPDKTGFLSLLGVLLAKYEPYEDEIDLKVIRPLAKQLPFPIEEHEWPKF
ncbi:hypothetical protein ACFQZS_03350 [Mucilaginibacter calamicampi]|uniref:Uncharacterized protein n=1 Tax=Mucilaginibacter calamicampi TaxID=1302352 RepID=A0ABW2YS69_9SPHI